MKKITLFSGQTYYVSEDEADNVSQLYNQGVLVELRCGDKINPKGIESISDYVIEKWNGNEIYKEKSGRKYFMREGTKIYLGSEELKNIETIKVNDLKALN